MCSARWVAIAGRGHFAWQRAKAMVTYVAPVDVAQSKLELARRRSTTSRA